ncbi:MAG TPA: ferritin-like domain-containing protein, partial [Chthoniobacterales bacterium]|nr:ferritin-like domain-containing protein [Chthoniobacterales bacterium]
LARKENDYITINFLQWFLTEQLEEVSSMDNLLKIVERAGDDLLQADEYLSRVGVKTMPEPPEQ